MFADGARQELRERRQDEHDRDDAGDGPCGVSHDGTERDREHSEHGAVEARPMSAPSTPGSPSQTATFECRIVAPTKNEMKVASSLTTKTTVTNTSALAAGTGVRRGTTSRLARIVPVAYSLEITSTPRTQIASWPSPNPAPNPCGPGRVGSAIDCCRWASSTWSHWETVSARISPVNPTEITTSRISAATLERTERNLVHSARTIPAESRRVDTFETSSCSRAADWMSARCSRTSTGAGVGAPT